MSNKVFKNYQINLGIPVQIRNPLNFQNIKKVDLLEDLEKEEEVIQNQEKPEEILENARQEAELLIKEAKLEAARLIELAENEANENSQTAYDEASRKGYEDGFEAARKQYADLIEEAKFIKEHARVEYREVLEGIETDIVNLVIDVARKVIDVELSFNREDLIYLIKQAFDRCTNKDNVILKVSPEDYDYVMENRGKLLSMVDGVGELDIKKDTLLANRACVIETPYGSVDAGVQTKLKKIEEAFLEVVGQ